MSSPTTLVADRYRLVKLIGSGGMGVVWHAWDERLHRAVALKMLRTQADLSDREREVATDRAMREARITAGLHHPHAVTVFDVVEYEGQPCIVMQLVESTPLSVLLREHGTLTPRETARIGAQVASALAAAHTMRIVHRDVKPGNILITEDGSAMLSDFGISHALGDTTITATGMVHGTPAYLAPEVAQGKPSSFASDVFSLGSTLYAMLEGAPPFGADRNALALLHRVARGDVPPPRQAGALEPLLRDMLASDPKRRPGMKSVAARLSAMLERTDAASESELPTVPVVAAATTAPDVGPEEAASIPASAPAETVKAAPTAPTEGLDEASAVHAATAQTQRLDEASGPHTPTAPTERLDEASGPHTPTAPTERLDETSAAPAPTAETERLGGAAVLPSLAWLAQGPPDPATVDAAPSQAPRTDAAPPRRGRGNLLVGALVVVGILIAGAALVFGTLRVTPGESGAPGAGEAPTASETSAAETPPAETESPQEVAASPPAAAETAEPSPPPSPEQRVVDTITTYYALLPGDRDTAWSRMTADYQENHVGGRGAYDAFWDAVAQVTVADVIASAPDQGEATLTYTFTDGSVVQEVTAYRMVEDAGVLKIAATEVLSSVEL